MSTTMPDIRDFKNLHQGRRCWIVGNGPSLNSMDLSLLAGEISFGMNCIFLGFERFGFRPTYYTVEDVFVAEDNAAAINGLTGMTKFIPRDLLHALDEDADTCVVDFLRLYKPYPQFSDDAAKVIYWGSTVTYLAMQLAFYMGCDPICLIGVDFDYTVPDYAAGQEEITSREDDVNHFHPAYFGKGKRWHNPRLDRVAPSYQEARRFCEAAGRTMINAGVGGKLEFFPRKDYLEALRADSPGK
jgi:hypothetical protein